MIQRFVMDDAKMWDAAQEAERYLNAELNEFYAAMKDKHGDGSLAAGMCYAVLFLAVGKLLTSEAKGCLSDPLTEAAKARLKEIVNQFSDVVNDYRFEIRQQSGSRN